jgi:hypothetical protein
MKFLSGIVLILFAAGSQLFASAHSNKFTGEWVMNIGTVNFVQHGNKVTGTIEGYGGFWNQPMDGKAKGKEVSFSTTWLGDFTLVLDGDQLKTKSPDLSFCGVRSDVTQVLQKGCGFTDKWIVAPNNIFPPGTYILLTQTAEQVTGDVYDGNGQIFDSITGSVYWGKGWRMNGATSLDPVTFIMNAAETGFEIVFDPTLNLQFCAVREGQTSAYLGYFTCQP